MDVGESLPEVCPTYVGMNRKNGIAADESSVCPTYVGMNRAFGSSSDSWTSMPHVCGDEPTRSTQFHTDGTYAPRMWG